MKNRSSKKSIPTDKMYADPKNHDRYLEGDAVMGLDAGSLHYKAYVGPPNRFDFMGATQFSLLFHMGIRDYHKVLDMGCGSLRLGRLLIPYLRESGYFGIDPNQWLIEDGIKNEIGQDAIDLKKPHFDHNTEFNCEVFEEKFDFIIAQSIFTHTGPDCFSAFLESSKNSLVSDGIALFTYIPTDDPGFIVPANGWHYPECVSFHHDYVENLVLKTGLVGRHIPWFHPASNWYCVATDEKALPQEDYFLHLKGAVLRQEQFKASLV